MTSWPAYLAELEQRLEIAEVGLLAGVLAVETFAPPEGIGPLPVEYGQWATALLDRTNTLEASLEAESARVATELAQARRRPTGPPSPPRSAFFDQAL